MLKDLKIVIILRFLKIIIKHSCFNLVLILGKTEQVQIPNLQWCRLSDAMDIMDWKKNVTSVAGDLKIDLD